MGLVLFYYYLGEMLCPKVPSRTWTRTLWLVIGSQQSMFFLWLSLGNHNYLVKLRERLWLWLKGTYVDCCWSWDAEGGLRCQSQRVKKGNQRWLLTPTSSLCGFVAVEHYRATSALLQREDSHYSCEHKRLLVFFKHLNKWPILSFIFSCEDSLPEKMVMILGTHSWTRLRV